MVKISNAKEIKKVEEIFFRIFKNKDPFGEMFQENIVKRMILCPIDGYYLNKNQYSAILEALKVNGERRFVISIIEGYNNESWLVETNTSYNEYLQLPVYLENAIFSTQGDWGLMISHEEYAVLGGDELFISDFLSTYSNPDEDIINFVEMWNYNKEKYKSDLNWLDVFFKHMHIENFYES